MSNWILLRSKSGQEKTAAEHVTQQGHEVYFPRYLRTRWLTNDNRRIRAAVPTALFPTYLFTKIDSHWRHLLSTVGVYEVLLRGDEPAPVRPEVIDLLRSRERDGFVELPPPPAKLRRNIAVQVTRGHLTGSIGLFLSPYSKHRVRVLLDLLGGKQTVLLPADSVRAVA